MNKLTNISSLRVPFFAVVIFLFVITSVYAQNSLNNVNLFQSYFFDAPISKTPYGEGGLHYSDYDAVDILNIGVQGGYPVNEKIEIEAGMGYISYSPNVGDGESGISDLGLYGRYNLSNSKSTNLSAGAMLTLPIGSDKIGESNLNFGGFGALRQALQNGIVLTGTVGLMFFEETEFEFNQATLELEEKSSYSSYLYIGVGGIYPVNNKLNAIGELAFQSKGDYMMLSGGIDYSLGSGRIRAALGIGLDDGAPDIMIIGGYAITL